MTRWWPIVALSMAVAPAAEAERGARLSVARAARLRDSVRPGGDVGSMLAPLCAIVVKKALGVALGFALLGFDRYDARFPGTKKVMRWGSRSVSWGTGCAPGVCMPKTSQRRPGVIYLFRHARKRFRDALSAHTDEREDSGKIHPPCRLLARDRQQEPLWKPPAIRVEVGRFFSNSEFPDISQVRPRPAGCLPSPV